MPRNITRIPRLCAAFCVLMLPGTAAAGGGQTSDKLCAAAIGEGRGQPDAERIAWAGDRKLAWTDFKATAPAAAVEASGSCVGFDVSWECTDEGLTFAATAVFDPARSWVRAGSGDDALLRHEQTHFDLTELSARGLRKRFTQLKDPCKDPSSVRRILDGATIEMYNEWGQAHRKYDEETGRGTEAGRQRVWDQRVHQELEDLKEFAPGR
jgi:hypothetical protein